MPGHARRTWSFLFVSLLALALLAIGAPTPARAHAALLSSTPADGASVATLPAQSTLTFSEDINPDFAQTVVQGSGGPVTVSPTVSGPVVTVPLPSDLGSGKIAVRYRVVSKDGHPIAGEIGFTVGTGAGGSASTPGAPATGASGSSGAPGSATASSGTAGAPTATASTGRAAGTSAGTSAVNDAGTNVVAYVLTSAGAVILISIGLLLWRWEKQRQSGRDRF